MSMLLHKCPVPFTQQPQNEFNCLKNSCFFSWPIHLNRFLFNLAMTWLISSAINILVISNFFSVSEAPWKFLVLDISTSNLVLVLVLVRLYLGWSYIVKRLLSATVFYEESGWYDGQVWIKTPVALTQDRLVGTYQALPLLLRIKKILLILSTILLLEFVFYMVS